MLQITLPAVEMWDEKNEMFVIAQKELTLQLEHSLVSISKWESKWCKSFFSKQEKTVEEIMDYIQCMTVTQSVKPETYNRLTKAHIQEINDYVAAPMTATTFGKESGGSSRELVTTELIYYWMFSLGIPLECQKWHLNRLITQIRVCNIKNQPAKKMSKKDIISRNAQLNAMRRQQLGTKG